MQRNASESSLSEGLLIWARKQKRRVRESLGMSAGSKAPEKRFS